MQTEATTCAAIESVVKQLVEFRQVGASSYINMPLLYPDGSCVTLRIDRLSDRFRVSDNGFAYREIEDLGAERSFAGTAAKIVEKEGLQSNRRAIYCDVLPDEMFRAVCDVSTASWRVVDEIYRRLNGREEAEIQEHLRERLVSVFGQQSVKYEHKIVGASSNEWDVSAIVQTDHQIAVFQSVGNHPHTIYRTTAAFHDLSALENPPRLVAVVRSAKALGPRLGLLSQAGRVIEDSKPDDVFKKAAA